MQIKIFSKNMEIFFFIFVRGLIVMVEKKKLMGKPY